MSILGTRVIRTEDPRLLTSGGVYVDDLREPDLAGAVRATFVRSTIAHAQITGIDTSAAAGVPGVVAVLTAADLDLPAPPPPEPLPDDAPPPEGPNPLGGPWSEPLLAVDRVRYVGEPVALVLTDSSYAGEDAAELVSVDYEPLPAVPSIQSALAEETLLFPEAGTNVCVMGKRPAGDEGIFDGCEVIVEGDIVNQRVAAMPMEPRATAAAWKDGKLTVWCSTQNAQLSRLILTAVGLPPDAIRVVAPDVGGGFGAKIGVDRDQILVAWAAKHTGRPVRWVETRSENLTAMTQGRAASWSSCTPYMSAAKISASASRTASPAIYSRIVMIDSCGTQRPPSTCSSRRCALRHRTSSRWGSGSSAASRSTALALWASKNERSAMSRMSVAAGSPLSASSAASKAARLARSLSPVTRTRFPATDVCSVPSRGSTITGCMARAASIALVPPNSRSSHRHSAV